LIKPPTTWYVPKESTKELVLEIARESAGIIGVSTTGVLPAGDCVVGVAFVTLDFPQAINKRVSAIAIIFNTSLCFISYSFPNEI
jgi:hypothetical protein